MMYIYDDLDAYEDDVTNTAIGTNHEYSYASTTGIVGDGTAGGT